MTPSHAPIAKTNRNNAKRMRKSMTDAERKLWYALRAHRLMGLGFRRQYPVRNYIVDFACPEYRLIVELDGSQHGNKANIERDMLRTSELEAQGWRVFRFWNDDVLNDLEGVCQHIITVTGVGDV